MSRSNPVPFLLTAAIALAGAGCATSPTGFVEASSYDEALALAADRGDLVLVDFYATWCGPCKRFAADLEEHAELRDAIAPAVFVRIDAESEDGGAALAERFGVDGYPTFLALDAEGRPVQRWSGYGDVEGFRERFAEVLEDPVTVDARVARFEQNPTVDDAEALAGYFADSGDAAPAVAYYRRAIELDPDARGRYLGRMFAAQTEALGTEDGFATEDLLATLDELGTIEGADPYDIANAARSLAHRSAKDETLTPAFEAVLPLALAMTAPAEETAAGEDEDEEDVTDGAASYLARIHTDLQLARAIQVDGDLDRAVDIKRASMPEGWTDEASALNSFAWWCFENEVNVDEALELAVRGAELAEPGSERAMILDTVAELCNLRGDCGEAIAWIEKAIAQDPDNEYYGEQKARFEKLLAEAGGATAAAGAP